MEGNGGSSNSIRILWIVLCLDALISLGEFIGGIKLGSLALWENFGCGVYDGLLLFLNIKGLEQEARGRKELGGKIALLSDRLLQVGFGLAVLISAGRLLGSYHVHINGLLVSAVALTAAIINYGCAKAIPCESINCKSARLKLRVGACVGAATFTSGILIHLTKLDFLDALITIGVGVIVVMMAGQRLADEKNSLDLMETRKGIHQVKTASSGL